MNWGARIPVSQTPYQPGMALVARRPVLLDRRYMPGEPLPKLDDRLAEKLLRTSFAMPAPEPAAVKAHTKGARHG